MKHPDPRVSALLRNHYPSPSLEYLRLKADFGWYVFGEVKVTDIEIQTGMTDERAFIALLSARLEATVEDMARHASEAPFIDAILRWRGEN